MTWGNAPWVTLGLIALNLLVFFFLQSGDSRIRWEAGLYYNQSQLGEVEFPAYTDWLREHDGDPQRLQWMTEAPAETGYWLVESDADFQQALREGDVIGPAHEDYDRWRTQRAEFERIRDSSFTARHALRFSQVEPRRLLSVMFLHGDGWHLFGNMLFLLLLGLLVEGALGPGRFLALYLVGGIGASLGSLAWRWGEYGMVVGASGAVAALMGGYCILWGLRRVRVFYWLLLVFGYVRVPALLLLPAWLGWELFHMLADDGSRVAFEAHAAGIVAGAGIALALRHGDQVRHEFVDEDERAQQHEDNEAAFQQALEHIGRLEIARAKHLLEEVDAHEPGQLRILAALYRCARYGGSASELDIAMTRLMQFPVGGTAEIQEIGGLYRDYVDACGGGPRIAARDLVQVIDPWLRHAGEAAVEHLLHSLGSGAQEKDALAAAWFKLALLAPEGSPERQARLNYLALHFPQSTHAGKARFLLREG